MRGLTIEERALLADCLTEPDFVGAEATDREWYVLTPILVAQGRVIIDSASSDEFDLVRATPLGALALRVCPPEDA